MSRNDKIFGLAMTAVVSLGFAFGYFVVGPISSKFVRYK